MRLCLFFFFNILRKLVDAYNGSMGLNDTLETIFQSPLDCLCTHHSQIQNSVSLIRIYRFWKYLSTKTRISYHLLVQPSWVAFGVEQSKHQKVSISPILLTRKSSLRIQIYVRVGKYRVS